MQVESHRPSSAPASLKVVVVDDSEDSAELLAELLMFIGHAVRVAHFGEEALQLLIEDVPDVVLLDVGLPDLDGYEVARAIRARFGAGIRLVALTGHSAAEAKERALDAGFDVFITKPCSVAQLENTLSP